MISEEIKDQYQVAEDAVEDHSLGSDFVRSKAVADASDKRDFLAETEDLTSHRHTRFEFGKASDKLVEVGATGLHQGQQSHDCVLNDPACLITTDATVDNVNRLFEQFNQGRFFSFFLRLLCA